MNIIYRRLVYIFFIIFFLIVTPLIILYTQGYRYDFNSGRIQKTGILIISSMPKKADIYLNNTLYTERQTPAKIEYLLSGDYDIRIEKENYHTWEKKLPIYENATAFAEKVILWLDQIPIILKTQNFTGAEIARDKNQIALVNEEDEVSIFKADKEENLAIGDLKNYNDIEIIGWLDNNQFIIQADHQVLLATERGIDKLSSMPIGAENIKWNERNNNNIYSSTNQGVWKTDLNKTRSEMILAVMGVEDFMIDGDDVYTLKKRKIFKSGKEITGVDCQACKFIANDRDKIILLDQTNQKLFIIDPENKQQPITTSAKAIDWLDQDTLLFYNDWEIWIYDFKQNKAELITRLGQPIETAIWHPLGRHIIFASGGQIRIIELDHREARNIIDLANISDVEFIYLDKDGEGLIINGAINGTERIFSLQIR